MPRIHQPTIFAEKIQYMFYRQYYSELGKVLYSIASINGVIPAKEKEKLKELVREELVPAEKHKDTFGSEAAYYVEIEFDVLEDEVADTEAAFDSFIDFINEHYSAITQSMRDSALRVAEKLAAVYHKTSKREKELLKKLKDALHALPASSH